MAIRRLNCSLVTGTESNQQQPAVSILPTVSAMKSCFEEYLNLTIADGGASVDTKTLYRSRLRQFLSWCDSQELYPALVGVEDIKRYRKHLIETDKSYSTIRLSLVSLRHFYAACIAKKLVRENPAAGLKAPVSKRGTGGGTRFLTQEELQVLIDAISPHRKYSGELPNQIQYLRDRILLGMLALQGCRPIELYRANCGDIEWVGENTVLTIDGKTSIRTALLRPDLAAEIEPYFQVRTQAGEKLNYNSPLFVSLSNSHYGQRLSRVGIKTIVEGYLQKCGLQQGSFNQRHSTYSLRHTAGTLSLQGGSSLREVQELLGHSDPKTTVRYTHIVQSPENNPACRIGVNF